MAARILIVDDNEAGRYVKQHILKKAGNEVRTEASGQRALEAIADFQPDLVMLDVNLPDVSGIQICQTIRDKALNVAVLMTSAAFVDSADRVSALDGGADGYLVEPIDPAELVASVRALLRLRNAEQALRSLNDNLEQRIGERTRELVEANQKLEAEKLHVAKAEEALWHVQRIESIGRLTGGIAHDFNNLLTVVLGNLELAEKDLSRIPRDDTEKALRHVHASRRAARDCADLTGQLLVFARRDGLRMEVVDVNQSIFGLGEFLKRSIGEQVMLEMALMPEPWPCKVDPAQFEAALLNLAVNARDAMPAGGSLRISTLKVTVGDGVVASVGNLQLPPDITPGDYVAICVSDKGTGMEQDVIRRAFEPFFTTKDIGKGSGLGLSQVFGFVKQSGGAISIDSVLGRGTQFNIFLPPSDDVPRAPRGAAHAIGDMPAGVGTILVVEDNDLVLDYVVALMRDLGYRALSATTGKEALDLIRRGEPIDLLFTDVVMPNGMTGIELARQARRLRPDLKVLITSGYSGSAGDQGEGIEFLSIPKPYRSVELANRLREILATR